MAFDDDDFDFEDLSAEDNEDYEKQMKAEKEKLRKHPLLLQAKEILNIVDALLDTCNDPMQVDMYGGTLRESAMIVVAKLTSAIPSDHYLLCMQNAAIIRDHAEYLRLSNHMLNSSGGFDKKHLVMFREEMEKFRLLFIEWAKEIHNMENDFEDEWGLFGK